MTKREAAELKMIILRLKEDKRRALNDADNPYLPGVNKERVEGIATGLAMALIRLSDLTLDCRL